MFEKSLKKIIATTLFVAMTLSVITPTPKVYADDVTLYVDVFIPHNISHIYDAGEQQSYDPDGRLYQTIAHEGEIGEKYPAATPQGMTPKEYADSRKFQSEVDSDFPDEANYYWVGYPVGTNGLTFDQVKEQYKVYSVPLNKTDEKGELIKVDSFVNDMIADGTCCYTITFDAWNHIVEAMGDKTSEYYDDYYEYCKGSFYPKKTYYYQASTSNYIYPPYYGDPTKIPAEVFENDPNGCQFEQSFLSFYDEHIIGYIDNKVRLNSGVGYVEASPEYMTAEKGEFPGYTVGQVQPINNYFISRYADQDKNYWLTIEPQTISEPYTGEKRYGDYDKEYLFVTPKETTTDDPINNDIVNNQPDNNSTGNNTGTNNSNQTTPSPITNNTNNNTVTGDTGTGNQSETQKTISLNDTATIKVKNEKGKKIKITWNKITGVKKYEIKVSTNKKFTKKTTKTYKTTKLNYTVKKLKKGKTYYIKVRGTNSGINWKWSSVKKVKVKK